MVTRCKHYFCEHCALKHDAKGKKCYVCNQPTQGIFNVAKDIIAKVKKQREAGEAVAGEGNGKDEGDGEGEETQG